MSLTPKQERYARLVASGLDYHTAAMDAGCKTHDSARKFVKDMAKRDNVQAFIRQLQTVQAGVPKSADNPSYTDVSYPNAQAKPSEQNATQQTASAFESPLEFLTSVFNNVGGLYTPKERITAAVALLPYTEQKLAQTGKKEDAIDTAKAKATSGRFSTVSHQIDMYESEIRQ